MSRTSITIFCASCGVGADEHPLSLGTWRQEDGTGRMFCSDQCVVDQDEREKDAAAASVDFGRTSIEELLAEQTPRRSA